MRTVLNRRRLYCAGGLVALATLSACGGAAAGADATGSVSAASSSDAPMTMPPMTMPPMTMPATSAGSSAVAPVSTNLVAIQSFAFGPQAVTVKVGATVTWTQQDEDSHTVTADDGSFASAPLANGQTYTHTFTAAGTYAYHCSIHPFMHGTVVVSNG